MISAHRPRGVGQYYRRLAPGRAAARAAARQAADHGLSFVALAAAWIDDQGARDMVASAVEEEYAAAFAERGIDVWVWGYPHAGKEAAFVAAMIEHARRLRACGVLLDPERTYRHAPAAANALINQMIDALDQSLGLGLTTYGDARMLAPSVRRMFAANGWCSPQVYTVEPWRARAQLEHWRDLGATHLIPSVPTFGPRSGGSLGAYLGALEDVADGFIAWSANSTSATEWRTLARWAARLSAGRREHLTSGSGMSET